MEFIENTAGRLPRVDQAAYTLNCVYQIHSSLSLYEHVEERLENLQVTLRIGLFFLSTVFYILFLGINGEPVSAVEH